MASDKIITISEENFKNTIAKGVTLVDFWAPWCGPCRMLAPVIDRVAEAVAGTAKVAKCNTDEAGSIAQAFAISAIPTLIIFKDGQAVENMVGVQNEASLVAKIKSHL